MPAALKSNIGHTEGAAGMMGVIKTVMVLCTAQAPPNLHLKELNPKLELDDFAVVMPQCVENLSRAGEAFFAGLSSFGYSGTNAHAVLQAVPSSSM